MQASVAEGKRDSPRIKRFKCESKLILKPSLEQRTLEINIRHCYHAPYSDRHLSSEVIYFILERSASRPSRIFQDLQTARPIGWEIHPEHQVYYQWQFASLSKWWRDPDPLCLVKILLSERSDVTSSEYRVDNVRGLGFWYLTQLESLPHIPENLL
jgi:hypothetical protein